MESQGDQTLYTVIQPNSLHWTIFWSLWALVKDVVYLLVADLSRQVYQVDTNTVIWDLSRTQMWRGSFALSVWKHQRKNLAPLRPEARDKAIGFEKWVCSFSMNMMKPNEVHQWKVSENRRPFLSREGLNMCRIYNKSFFRVRQAQSCIMPWSKFEC